MEHVQGLQNKETHSAACEWAGRLAKSVTTQAAMYELTGQEIDLWIQQALAIAKEWMERVEASDPAIDSIDDVMKFLECELFREVSRLVLLIHPEGGTA
ncbi:hypothetical protein [Phyllobacterium sp. P5_D12]